MASRKMNLEEAVDFMDKLPDDSQELDVDLDDSEELSVEPVIDIPVNSFSEVPDENNNTLDTALAQHASDFVTIQIMEISEMTPLKYQVAPKDYFHMKCLINLHLYLK